MYLFTSESVTRGHPDKVADQISDAILDECLKKDPDSRVAAETLVSQGLVVLAGEISTQARLNYRDIARQTLEKIGYNEPGLDFDYHSCAVISGINRQSPDIAQGVDRSEGKLGAGDQGMMFGYACIETPELMPLPISLANRLSAALRLARENKELPYLRPDGKTQVTVEYSEHLKPKRVHTVVMSAQHNEEVSLEQLREDLTLLIKENLGSWVDEETKYYINPTGRFCLGGPAADCGLTGRKLMVDSYGAYARHGGGAFSGKDPSKVDRCAAYAARYVAKNVVAAGLARSCEIEVAYAIGVPEALEVYVKTQGTGVIEDELLTQVVAETFDFSPSNIISALDLKRPIYSATAFEGHFGREDLGFSWEKKDLGAQLKQALRQRGLDPEPIASENWAQHRDANIT